VSYIKKAISILICLLFLLTILYPAGAIITSCLGYNFELISFSAFAIVIATLSVCIIVLDLICKNTAENKFTSVLLVVITPLSLINAVFYIIPHPQNSVIIGMILSVGCCCYLTIKHGKPLFLKTISLGLSVLMLFPIGFFGPIVFIVGNIAQSTVVRTVESPSGEYYAKVIDSSQGALGGNTFVDVQQRGLNAVVFKIEKNPQRVYSGDWGESKYMHIYWKDDNCLVINSVEYELPKSH